MNRLQGGLRQEKGSMFFFGKKNQKTFIPCARRGCSLVAAKAAAKEQKFFGSFFQKRTAAFLKILP
jgi:hypothetical protein